MSMNVSNPLLKLSKPAAVTTSGGGEFHVALQPAEAWCGIPVVSNFSLASGSGTWGWEWN